MNGTFGVLEVEGLNVVFLFFDLLRWRAAVSQLFAGLPHPTVEASGKVQNGRPCRGRRHQDDRGRL